MTEFEPLDPYEVKGYQDEYHALISVQLDELVADGVFSWDRDPMKGSFDGLGSAVARRMEEALVERYRWEEISITPPGRWMQQLAYTISYELVPKYLPLFQAIEGKTFNPTQGNSEYFKERRIGSEFPETLLSGNSDYASDGEDREYERIYIPDSLEMAEAYYSKYKGIEKALLDELEGFFACMWSVNANVL